MQHVTHYFQFRLAILSCLFSFSLAAPAAGPLFGVHVTETSLEDYVDRLDAAHDLGIKLIRIPVDWVQLEPTEGSYNTGYVTQVKGRVAHAQSQSQRVVLMLGQSPGWAQIANGSPAYPPTVSHYQDYADAMKFIHTQLIDPNDEFQIDAATVLAWEVWNEPNVIQFWPTHGKRSEDVYILIDLAAAAEYAALLGKTYDTMKAAFPTLTILGGSLASADTEYLDALYAAGAGEKFDHLSLHPYTRVDEEAGPHQGQSQYPDQCNESDNLAPPWCYKKGVENIRQTLDAHGDENKQIWFTEFGTSSSVEYGFAGDEVEQQEHMKRALDILGEWFNMSDAMKIPVAITYRLEDRIQSGNNDLFGLYQPGLSIKKPVADEIAKRLDAQGELITCDSTVTAANNQWSMLSLPCSAPPGATINDLFGDDIVLDGEPGVYAVDWVVFTYDAEVGSYQNPGINGALEPGQGFWFFQSSGNDAMLDMPAASQPVPSQLPGGACQSPLGCAEVALSGAANSGAKWNLVGNPLPSNVTTEKVTLLTSSSPCSVLEDGCNLNEAVDFDLLYNTFWHYTEGAYVELNGAATINQWVGFWAAELPAAAGSDAVMQIPILR